MKHRREPAAGASWYDNPVKTPCELSTESQIIQVGCIGRSVIASSGLLAIEVEPRNELFRPYEEVLFYLWRD